MPTKEGCQKSARLNRRAREAGYQSWVDDEHHEHRRPIPAWCMHTSCCGNLTRVATVSNSPPARANDAGALSGLSASPTALIIEPIGIRRRLRAGRERLRCSWRTHLRRVVDGGTIRRRADPPEAFRWNTAAGGCVHGVRALDTELNGSVCVSTFGCHIFGPFGRYPARRLRAARKYGRFHH